jgi:hypothetical protein
MSINQIPKTRSTSHFKDFAAAMEFHKHLPLLPKERERVVKEKVKEAQIFLSPPPCKDGEVYLLINGRYYIQEI